MIRLEETVRDLKAKIGNTKSNDSANTTIQYETIDATQLTDLQKANAILMKSKEAQFKKG